MDSIVDKLYQIQVNSGDFFAQVARGEESLREWELYTLLYEGLKEEDKKIFLEYVQLKGERENRELKASFQCGVHTAIKLLMEGLKE